MVMSKNWKEAASLILTVAGPPAQPIGNLPLAAQPIGKQTLAAHSIGKKPLAALGQSASSHAREPPPL
jgi:hypothetical protein